MSQESLAYAKYKNLKLAADDIGIPWSTLYYRLKKQGVKIIGDRLKYGSDRDKLGSLAESEFKRLVPSAVSMNEIKWQYKYDFTVNNQKVDVKCSKPRILNRKYKSESWSFSFKKQTLVCDFMCCFCMDKNRVIKHILLVPSEFFKGLQTVSVSCKGESKWLDYSVTGKELNDFFESF